ncbi:MAG: electron transport complex protein RnfD [Halothiobacillaceae bacterium]|nr:MAG: electron transport complex protein RnfD [Halothiobacillaceae bacterium]
MPLQTPSSPHVHQPTSVTAIMLRVVYALIPGIITYIYFFGWAIVVNLTLAALVALLCEALMLTIRRRPVIPFLMDGSALVTALLLALAIPTLAPWWLTTVGVAFAIIIAKQLYGGLGYNPFNPAMVGYAILMISFPREMTAWLPPEQLATESFNLIESASIIFTGLTTSGIAFDAVSSATPLDILKTGVNLAKPISDVVAANPIFNAFAGVGWMQLAHPRWPARHVGRRRHPVLSDQQRTVCQPAVPSSQWRHHARRLLHRHRPGYRLHHPVG